MKIAVKFSSQEDTRPPRIQEEKIGFDSKFLKSRLVYRLDGKIAPGPVVDLQEAQNINSNMSSKPNFRMGNEVIMEISRWDGQRAQGPNFWNGFQPGSATFEKWSLNSIRSLTT